MIKSKYSIFCTLAMVALLYFSSCQQQEEEPVPTSETVKFSLTMSPFEGDAMTRTTVSGEGFEAGDKIRFKIFCPNSKSHELGETWGSYYTITVPNEVNETTSFFMTSGSNSDGSYGSYEAQSTTYIYTAINTTGTRIFAVGDYRYSNPSNFFYADQSKLEFFKKSDLVWAQAVRQTGAREVHLNFKHKVAKLDITIEDDGNVFSDNTILTLEGMPDIDGAEIVVGDYYADESYEDYSFNYKTKCSCSYENNGKVIGIEVIDEANKKSIVNALTGNPYPAGGTSNSGTYSKVPNTGTYRAYKDPNFTPDSEHPNNKHYMVYIPPCDLDPGFEPVHVDPSDPESPMTQSEKRAVVWLRDGTKRYSVALDQLSFEEGKCYKQTIKIANNTATE